EEIDECRRDAGGGARFCHHLAKHGAESDDDGDEPEYVADAILKRFHRRAGWHPRRDPHCQRHDNESDERVQLRARDEQDQRNYRDERVEEKASVGCHVDARATRSATISAGDFLISHTHACSSEVGSSRVASWLSSIDGGMKCPARLARRSASNSRGPFRKMKLVPGASALRVSR